MHYIIPLVHRFAISMTSQNEYYIVAFFSIYYSGLLSKICLRVKILWVKKQVIEKYIKSFHMQELQMPSRHIVKHFPMLSAFKQHSKKYWTFSIPSQFWHFSKGTFTRHTSFAYGKILYILFTKVKFQSERIKTRETDDT